MTIPDFTARPAGGEKGTEGGGWSFPTFLYLTKALRDADEALRQSEIRFAEERDRRYAEVNVEKEKALKIKEEADKQALLLAREIQTYKDEKANELREQISRERGLYATKDDVTAAVGKLEVQIKPALDFVTGQQGRGAGVSATTKLIATGISVVLGLILIATFFAPLLKPK